MPVTCQLYRKVSSVTLVICEAPYHMHRMSALKNCSSYNLAGQYALEQFHRMLLLFHRQGRSALERIFQTEGFVLVFAHYMVWQDVHTLHHTVLAYVARRGKQVFVIVVDAWCNHMADPYRLAYALQILHHLVRVRTMMRRKSVVQLVVHSLYVEKDEIRDLQETTNGIIEDDTTGVQCRMYALLPAQTEIFFYERCLDKGLTTSTGYTASPYEVAITESLLQQLLGCPFILHRCPEIPCIGIVAEKATHGTSLHEGKEAYAGTIHRAERLQGMYTTNEGGIVICHIAYE